LRTTEPIVDEAACDSLMALPWHIERIVEEGEKSAYREVVFSYAFGTL
jgi:hypothetical protein